MNGGLLYTDPEGREWKVTLDAPGKVLAVEPPLERSGAMLPQHEVRIVFSSGDDEYSQEYTSLTPLEELSDEELQEWLEGSRSGHGL